MHRILERSDKPFDAQWMHETFDIFWDYAQWVVKWTNSLLVPPVPQILRLMDAASRAPPLARKIANGFNHPQFPYLAGRSWMHVIKGEHLQVPGQLLAAPFPNHIVLDTNSGQARWETSSKEWIPEDLYSKFPPV